MRWERLFADLEAQAEAADTAEFAAEVEERTRIEVGALRLLDRLRAVSGHPLRLTCLGGESVAGTLSRVGSGWLLLAERPDREAIVPVAAITSVAGLGRFSAGADGEGRVGAGLGLRHALRGLARDRTGVMLILVDGTSCVGTIDRVGSDFIEVAEHAQGEPRRVAAVRQVRAVPLAALAVVRAMF